MLDAWDSAVEFLLVDDRARNLAKAHPLVDGRCSAYPGRDCSAAKLAAEALAVLATRHRMAG
jgi:hypothetical protein